VAARTSGGRKASGRAKNPSPNPSLQEPDEVGTFNGAERLE